MITIDATALTLDVFTVSGFGQFPPRTPKALSLAPGTYRFGTLFGPTFILGIMHLTNPKDEIKNPSSRR